MGLSNFNPSSPGDDDGSGLPPGIPVAPNGGTAFPWSGQDDEFDPQEYLINYNEKFRNEPPTLFRDSVIQQTLACLIGKFKPNALLVGAAGVGKTKVIEDIARRIANDDPLIPDQLRGYTVWELPLSNVVCGSSLVGELEKKTRAVLDFARDPKNKVILFIDEIHMLIGESQVYDKIAQIMKPALARGDIKVAGATTLQESQNLLADPAFNRRFTPVIVDELSKEQTKVILSNLQMAMFSHYCMKVAVNDKVIEEVVNIADEYGSINSHRPDNAITLLDRAMAEAYISRKVLEEQAKSDPSLQKFIQASPIVTISKAQLQKTAMKLATGNNERKEVDFDVLRQNLSVIKGQDDVIDYLVDVLERRDLDISVDRTDKRPLAILFAGNSGVGKSEIAKIVANTVSQAKPIILNMAEYHSSASINRIIGAPAGYVGSDSKAELPFDILETNPYQLILLDEFEKCDRSVQRLFMSAFDEGYIKTARGKTVDFSKAIIIATTNAGHTGRSATMGFTEPSGPKGAASVKELSEFFDTELLNRFTAILQFGPITEQLFKDILADSYARQVAVIKDRHSAYGFLPDAMDPADVDTLAKAHYNKDFGARPVKNAVRKHIEDAILAKKRASTAQAQTPSGQDGDGPAE